MNFRRIVVKIGSSSLARRPSVFAELAGAIGQLQAHGVEVVLVSSGAVALGVSALKLAQRPNEIPMLQACAAVGQSLLMRAWQQAFTSESSSRSVAQVLLTHADLSDRERYLHVQRALVAMHAAGAIAVINENDTVSVEEITFGDNDQLAAMVATLISADLLVLLTDVEGVLDGNGVRVQRVEDPQQATPWLRAAAVDSVGTGGMASKLRAAHLATLRGVPAVIADARDPRTLLRVTNLEDVGTWVGPATPARGLSSRKHWIGYTLRPTGTLVVDDGARAALQRGGNSLLCAGVLGVRGDFAVGDAVRLVTPTGHEIARGLVRFGVQDLARIAGHKAGDIALLLAFEAGPEVVHRDDLTML